MEVTHFFTVRSLLRETFFPYFWMKTSTNKHSIKIK